MDYKGTVTEDERMTILPDPGIGRNPPRYQRLVPTYWGQRHLVLAALIAFAVAIGIYYIFAV